MNNYEISPRKKGLSLTVKLIILNVILYLISLLLVAIYGEGFLLNNFALIPSNILSGKALWSILTCMFLHGSFFHLFANMFSLFFIGIFLENIIGKKRFLLVYIFAGFLGGGFYILAGLIFGGVDVPAVGASGAIFGLLGVLAVLIPFSRIYLIAGPLILIVAEVILLPSLPSGIAGVLSVLINILIFAMIFAILSPNSFFRKLAVPVELPMWLLPIVAIVPLSVIGFFVELPIGNSAHFGGLVLGLIYGFYLRRKFPRKTSGLSRMFRGR